MYFVFTYQFTAVSYGIYGFMEYMENMDFVLNIFLNILVTVNKSASFI